MPGPGYAELLRRVRDPDRIRSSGLIRRVVHRFRALETPDKALVAGRGSIGGRDVLVFGQEKPTGHDADQAREVNFGMMRAAGYWFVVEQLEKAAASQTPVLTLIDTPGADPTKNGVEQLLAWAVSATMSSFIAYPGPVVSVVIGEGGSGGAIALQIADRRLMVSDSFYSVISPESCSAILFRDHHHIPEAMAVLKPSAENMLQARVIDQIVEWPDGVSSRDHDRAAELLEPRLVEALESAVQRPVDERLEERTAALFDCGRLVADRTTLELSRPLSGEPSPPETKRFVDADVDDHSIAALRQTYFAEQGLDDYEFAETSIQCPPDAGGCGAVFTHAAYQDACWACPSCGRGDRLSAAHWIEIVTDPGSFQELYPDLDLRHLDDDVYDNDVYRRQRQETRQRTGASESMCIGRATIGDVPAALAVSDFRYMGGTLGAAAGEKFRLICSVAQAERLPVVSVVCSGGVRMQDGTLGLLQMARANAAAQELMDDGLPHVVIMADPCTGGAMASYATCASTILAEPRALLSFAGPRVLQLAGLPVNEADLVGEAYARHGGIDEILPRTVMRERLKPYLVGELTPAAPRTTARRLRARTRRRVSAWFGEFMNQLTSVIDGARGLIEVESSELVQANVVTELAELASTGIPALLVRAARNTNARVRASAVAALARLPHVDQESVEDALADPHHRVRAEAALGLLLRDPAHAAAQQTVAALLNDAQPVTRRHGLYVATGAPLDAFRKRVHELCADADNAVRLAAGVAAVAGGDTERGLGVVRASIDARASRDTWRVERLLGMMQPSSARWLRGQLDLD